MGRINTGRLGLKSDKHRGPTALGVYLFKPRPTGIYSTHYIPPRNVLFLNLNLSAVFNLERAIAPLAPLNNNRRTFDNYWGRIGAVRIICGTKVNTDFR